VHIVRIAKLRIAVLGVVCYIDFNHGCSSCQWADADAKRFSARCYEECG
jgi:hypothetical protein